MTIAVRSFFFLSLFIHTALQCKRGFFFRKLFSVRINAGIYASVFFSISPCTFIEIPPFFFRPAPLWFFFIITEFTDLYKHVPLTSFFFTCLFRRQYSREKGWEKRQIIKKKQGCCEATSTVYCAMVLPETGITQRARVTNKKRHAGCFTFFFICVRVWDTSSEAEPLHRRFGSPPALVFPLVSPLFREILFPFSLLFFFLKSEVSGFLMQVFSEQL